MKLDKVLAASPNAGPDRACLDLQLANREFREEIMELARNGPPFGPPDPFLFDRKSFQTRAASIESLPDTTLVASISNET